MASITKRPDGKYRARYRDPAGRERAKHFARKVDAQKWLDPTGADMARGAYVDPGQSRQTFLAFADAWAEAQDWKATTRESWGYVRARL